jgi:predicted transport protein
MPLFEMSGERLVPVEQANFPLEKELQNLIEKNLEAVFSCRLVASEFSTGALHAGRIDSLALSEDNNPVIIEYKKVESSELINQSLFYLHWVQDHKGDFEMAVQRALGNGVEVDWSDIRVICIAPNYKKYDLHAVQVMGANIELWKYRLFKNSSIYLEEVFQATKVSTSPSSSDSEKNPVMVEAGKKAAQVRATATYEFDEHLKGKSENIQSLMYSARDFIVGLDPAIEEVPKKFYVAYKISQNIVCMEPQSRSIKLFAKLSPSDFDTPPRFYRDVTEIGHFGTGNAEFTISSEQDLDAIKPYLEMAYNKVGG